MKNILWVGLFVLAATAVSAQTIGAGYAPQSDESNVPQGAEALPFQVPAASGNVALTPAAVQGAAQAAPAPQGGGLFPELGQSAGNSAVSGNSGLIHLIIDKVTVINPAMEGVSVCSGTLTVENQTAVRISRLNLTLRYGTLDVPVSFGGVAPLGGRQTQSIAWAGENCNHMLSVPTITVQSCAAGPMSLAECQNKLKYMPIR